MKKKVNRRQRKYSESHVKRGYIAKAQDQGAKVIFENPELMAQLLRDYVPREEVYSVTDKIWKGFAPPEISEILEEKQNTMEMICKAAGQHAPEYDAEKIIEQILKEPGKAASESEDQ